MTTTHAIAVTIRHGAIDTRFSCTAEEGARCRLICAEDCESWSWNHEEEMREGYLEDGETADAAAALAARHRLVDNGSCGLVEFIENDEADLYELYEGDPAPFRSGPVELTYQGEYVAWAYAKGDEHA